MRNTITQNNQNNHHHNNNNNKRTRNKRGKLFYGYNKLFEISKAITTMNLNLLPACDEIYEIVTYYKTFMKNEMKEIIDDTEKILELAKSEMEIYKACRLANAVMKMDMKSSDKRKLKVALRKAEVRETRRRKNEVTTTTTIDENEEEDKNNNAILLFEDNIPEEVLREIFLKFNSKTDIVIASLTCKRWHSLFSKMMQEEQSTKEWFSTLQRERQHGPRSRIGNRLQWLKATDKSSSLCSAKLAFEAIKDICREERRKIKEISSSSSQADSEVDEEEEVDSVSKHKFWSYSIR